MEKGDIVEVVIGHPGNSVCPAIVKGNRHVVNDTDTCPSCKRTFIDIGFAVLKPGHKNCSCGGGFRKKSNVVWYEHLFFRKIEPNYKVVEVSESIIKKELVFN